MINDVKIRTIDGHPDILSITIRGSLDTMLAYQVRENIEQKIRQGHLKFLLNLKDLEYISSAGIGVFSALILRLQKQHGRIMFVDIPESVYNLLQSTRLLEIFPIAETDQDAIQQLQSPFHTQ